MSKAYDRILDLETHAILVAHALRNMASTQKMSAGLSKALKEKADELETMARKDEK